MTGRFFDLSYSRWPCWVTREALTLGECLVTQLCPTLCNPMNCSLPGFSVHWTLQARILEWVAISPSRGSSWPRDQTHISCVCCIADKFLVGVFCFVSFFFFNWRIISLQNFVVFWSSKGSQVFFYKTFVLHLWPPQISGLLAFRALFLFEAQGNWEAFQVFFFSMLASLMLHSELNGGDRASESR